jgi:hypothetical protein
MLDIALGGVKRVLALAQCAELAAELRPKVAGGQYAPLAASTAGMVRSRIEMSSQIDQFSR